MHKRIFVLYICFSLVFITIFDRFGQLFEVVFFILVAYRAQRKNQTLHLLIFYGIFTVLSVTIFNSIIDDIEILTLPAQWVNDDNVTILDSVINPLLTLICLLFVSKLIQPNMEILRKNIDLQKRPMLKLINIVFFSSYALRLLDSSLHERENYYYLDFLFFLSLILFMFYLSKSAHLFLERQLSQERAHQLEQMEEYTRQIESLYGELRQFRHDYINLFLTMEESIRTEDMEQIKEIYDGVVRDTGTPMQDTKYSLGKLSQIRISPIKSIFSNKLICALEKGIAVEIEIEKEFTACPINLVDFVRILAILLDNAIEASVKSEARLLAVALIADEKRQEQRVIIENTTEEKKVLTNRIFHQGFSTKGEGRGIGLATVKNILEAYPNVQLETEARDFRFKQTLIIGNADGRK